MAQSLVERYSTDCVPASERLGYWNDRISETFDNLVVDSDRGEAFSGVLARAPLGALGMMSAESAAARVSNSNDPFRSRARPPVIYLHLQHAGRSSNAQFGREATLEAGDFTLCDATRPYEVRFAEANHMLVVRLPAEQVAARVGDPETLSCVAMSGSSGGAAVLSSFLRSLWSQIDVGHEEGWADSLSDTVLDLAALAYRPNRGLARTASPRSQRRSEAIEYIEGRLGDPGLRVSEVAAALGLTPRYLQLLFAELATTPGLYILERRLALAAEQLRGPAGRGSVTMAAMAAGFGDLTYFGRAFRKRFGVTPRDYAAGGRAKLAATL